MTFQHLIPEIEKMGINLYAMAFYRDGEITEHRFQPSSNCHNCYSVAKAFAMTAVGMLHDDGLIDVKKPIRHYMSSLMPENIDPAWQLITVENVLTHKIGYGEGFLDIDVEDVNAYPTRDYLRMVFDHKLTYLPGQQFKYSDAAYYLICRLVAEVSGEKADVFLNRRLFQPMDFKEVAWSHCPQDHPMGATGLYIGTADMVKLGALYLEGGMWKGKRMLSEEWIRKAIGNEYELHVKSSSGLIGKGGMYGQHMLFNREKNYAIGWHAFAPSEQVKDLITFVDKNLD